MNAHARAAERLVRDDARLHWHDAAVWNVRAKRDRAAQAVPDWEALRDAASRIKLHTLSRLPEYLEEFERKALALGARVHWAADAAEHNAIVLGLLRERGVTRLVKSKSMLTEECHLNPELEKAGIEVVDTDLGERIVQLAHEPPSHIVLPAVHMKREEIGDLFHRTIGTPAGLSDPKQLTEAARQHLRAKFMASQAGLTGVNFAVAETGGFVVCTNEGNADLGVSLPPIHIACMGVEKLVPRAADLAVFLRLLARSGTGQPITTYTSHFHGPRPGGELHIVLVDNGRSTLLASETHRRALCCIRCGACMNHCPVYQNIGGHAYGWVYPGPIGSILTPAYVGIENAIDLPNASTLCNQCGVVCPVKIPLPDLMRKLREQQVSRKLRPWSERFGLRLWTWAARRPLVYALLTRMVARTGKWLGGRHGLLRKLPGPGSEWTSGRDLPAPQGKTFRDLYARRSRR